jgi:predicted nucleic acid-binding protein
VEVKVLLDTNAYVEFLGNHAGVAGILHRAERVLFSAVVAGELLHGFRKGRRYGRNLRALEEFLDDPGVDLVPVTLSTANRYGLIRTQLRSRGKPIPSNDIWIAAQALEHGADLLSFDAHFAEIGGLSWIDPSSL